MASVWKHPKSKYWSACFTLADGQRVKESTKLTKQAAALAVACALETEGRAGMNDQDARALSARLHERYGMSANRARKMVASLYERIGGRAISTATVETYVEQWQARKKSEVAAGTARKYSDVCRQFLAFLDGAAKNDIALITGRDIAAFRDHTATRLAVGSANVALKIIRIVFADALRAKLVTSNEAAGVSILKVSSQKGARRPFTDLELRALLAVADPEWRAMILASFYAGGQRLGDVARWTWQNVDLARAEIRFVTGKTGRRQVVPICGPLFKCLKSLSGSDPKAAVFPHAAEIITASKSDQIGALSNEFHALLVKAGFAVARSHGRKGAGRSARRQAGELSFHSLRHTFTSWAKSVGIGNAIVQDLVGHDSAATSEHYTTIDEATKRTALNALPDLTAQILVN